ncbi:HD domain-containing protein [Psychrosphaera sp. B3R10]|uniref:HD domain-containing phosphohydrolase n=1 Tax=unclassified Psychrosphaera TaxID=2641570 RepID=UPI001C09DA7A|nr:MULTISPECIES: HD domain-containing phosphohydrolase [unclassified Psychrosphaera]MBU2881196.1 HD domain-containing protein [Psychrosphaera sp. I2R16]MBU2988301.1 HD domain-containing protein [Psychrosphaera sp. B3R10]
MENRLNTFLSQTFLTKNEAAQEFLEIFIGVTNSIYGYIHFIDENVDNFSLTVWSKSVISKMENGYKKFSYLPNVGPWSESIKVKKVLRMPNKDQKYYQSFFPHPLDEIAEYICFPLIIESKVIAVIGAASDNHYNSETVANISKIFRKNVRKLRRKFETAEDHYLDLKANFQSLSNDTILVEMLMAISNALELRDAYTTHHQKNVAHISEQIAIELGLKADRVFGLRIGALIHDLGKIVIPSQLLNKSGKIEQAEFEYLKLHAEKGAFILKDAHFPWPIQKMVGQHHERLDGSGYPLGLKENEIILEAKIIAVADTYDAMANDRPYRERPGIAKAIATLQAGRMTKYDPYVLDAFISCFERDPTFGGRYKLD